MEADVAADKVSTAAAAVSEADAAQRNRTSWDPLECLHHRMPTPAALKRIRSDIRNMFKDPLPGIFVVPDEDNAVLAHAIVTGPFETPYEGGFFYFLINFPDDYPLNPPKVRLMTTGGGTVRFNPNLYADGKVCLSILGTWSGPAWTPVHTLSSVLLSIQSLMNDAPYRNEPGYEDKAGNRELTTYNDCIRHETMRVAVCETFEDNTFSRTIPEQLRQLMRGLFGSFYDGYVMTCEANMSKDGHVMVDPFGHLRGVYQYGPILRRIQACKEAIGHVDDEDDDDDDVDEDEGDVEERNGENGHESGDDEGGKEQEAKVEA